MADEIKKIIYSLNHYERKILPFVHLKNIQDIAKQTKIEFSIVNTIVQLLANKGFLNYLKKEEEIIILDKFGEKFQKNDLPEIKFLKSILNKPKTKEELNLENEEFTSAIGILKRNNLIEIKNNENKLVFSITKEGIDYLKNNKTNPLIEFKEGINKKDLTKTQKEIIENFKNRKGFLKTITKKEFYVELTEKGEKITKELIEKYQNLDLIETINTGMLKTGNWKNREFRHYDINLKTSFYDIGRRHPMVEANNILREIFIQMGFTEMEGPMVESAFWNMDIMWIPQDHPARDEQDTFYLDESSEVPKELMKKVKQMHETGMKKTHTPTGEWSEEITKKRLLRTHSTATSFRTLYNLIKNNKLENGKYFYIANNFRNEAIDATHLAEFFQAEGFIIGDDLSLADLMGFIKEFYLKLGIDKIKFKPTFNPYTEPSMEAHYYDKNMNKWYALINSGIFRPETLKPLGINKTIIAWGMGASRLATLLTGAKSMKDITGYTCDFEWLKTRPEMQKYIVEK